MCELVDEEPHAPMMQFTERGDRLYRGEVRLVSAAQHHCPLAALPLRNRLLRGRVQIRVPRDQRRRPTAETVRTDRTLCRFNHARMMRQPEVIVTGKIDV